MAHLAVDRTACISNLLIFDFHLIDDVPFLFLYPPSHCVRIQIYPRLQVLCIQHHLFLCEHDFGLFQLHQFF